MVTWKRRRWHKCFEFDISSLFLQVVWVDLGTDVEWAQGSVDQRDRVKSHHSHSNSYCASFCTASVQMISILLSINFQAAAKPSERPLRPAHERSLSKFSFELSNVHDEMEEVLSLGVVGGVAAVVVVYPAHIGIKLRWPG